MPGFNWLQILVTGLQGVPVLAHLWWWTTHNKKRVEEGTILKKVAKLWAQKVIPFGIVVLQVALGRRWHSIDRKHQAWKVVRGKRSWSYRMIWDACRRCHRKTGGIAAPIHLPNDQRQLFLVVSRPRVGHKPW